MSELEFRQWAQRCNFEPLDGERGECTVCSEVLPGDEMLPHHFAHEDMDEQPRRDES